MLSDNWLQLIQPVISVKFTGHSLIHIWKRCHWVVTDIKEALQRELDFFQYVDRVQVYLRHYVAKLWLKKEKRMIGPVCWEWVLREERLRKGRWEVERHLMALHDACFWNELWKCIQPLLEITTVSHKGAANRADLSGTSHCSQSWTRAHHTRGKARPPHAQVGSSFGVYSDSGWVCVYSHGQKFIQSHSLSWLASFERIDLKGMKENGKGDTT